MNWDNIKYFKPLEFACKCKKHFGQPVYDMDENLIIKLDKFREKWGHPIYVTSGWRCEEYNKQIGGAKYSMHIKKLAADITSPNLINIIKLKEFFKLACEMGFNGVGFYPVEYFIHIDTAQRIQYWRRDINRKYFYLLV